MDSNSIKARLSELTNCVHKSPITSRRYQNSLRGWELQWPKLSVDAAEATIQRTGWHREHHTLLLFKHIWNISAVDHMLGH